MRRCPGSRWQRSKGNGRKSRLGKAAFGVALHALRKESRYFFWYFFKIGFRRSIISSDLCLAGLDDFRGLELFAVAPGFGEWLDDFRGLELFAVAPGFGEGLDDFRGLELFAVVPARI